MRPCPSPTKVPVPLPRGLIPQLAAQRKLLLFLDYDGTISEITPDLFHAAPIAGASEVIAALAARHDRVQLAIISGREIDELLRLLKIVPSDLLFSGTHGLEIMERDGQRWLVSDLKPFIPELDKVRQWLERNVPPDRGFIVEDKRISIALHYRSAAPAESRSMCEKFADMVDRDTRLRLHHGKRVVEASPPNSGKGFAVRFLIQRYDEPILPVYFGDDLSDEDAFFTLREDGITVLVSAVEKVSWAKYRVESPFEVIQTLSDLADATNLENSKPAS